MDFAYFAYWLANMGLPMTIAAIAIVAVCVIILFVSAEAKERLNVGDPKYTDATTTQIYAGNVGLFTAILWAVVMAAPYPNYKVEYKTVEKIVEKKVPVEKVIYKDKVPPLNIVVNDAQKIMDKCMEDIDEGYSYTIKENTERLKACGTYTKEVMRHNKAVIAGVTLANKSERLAANHIKLRLAYRKLEKENIELRAKVAVLEKAE